MKQPTNTLDQQNDSRIDNLRDNLEQREDIVGQGYRTIRDNPKTSAGIAAGVAAVAGAGAFLLNRKSRIGTAFGHSSARSEIEQEVIENNEENLSKAKA